MVDAQQWILHQNVLKNDIVGFVKYLFCEIVSATTGYYITKGFVT